MMYLIDKIEDIWVDIKRGVNEIKYKASKRMANKYDVIILGEEHVDLKCLEREYEIIREIKPSAVFFEGRSIPPKETSLKPEFIRDKYGVNVPDKPIYLWNDEELRSCLDEIGDKIRKIYNECKMKDEDDDTIEKKIEPYENICNEISKLKLHLAAEPWLRYGLMLSDLSAELGFKVIGHDHAEAKKEILEKINLEYELKNKIADYLEQLTKIDGHDDEYGDVGLELSKIFEGLEQIQKDRESLHKEREQHMAEKIAEYLEKNVNRPVVVIVGKRHAKPIEELLKQRNYRTKVIDVSYEYPKMEKNIKSVMYEVLLTTKRR